MSVDLEAMDKPDPEDAEFGITLFEDGTAITERGIEELLYRLGSGDMLFRLSRITPSEGDPYVEVHLGAIDGGVVNLRLPVDADGGYVLHDMAHALLDAANSTGRYHCDDCDGGDEDEGPE